MKQAIQVPQQVTNTIFNLPCIFSVHKEIDTICYLVYGYDNVAGTYYIKAYPTDWLVEDDNGEWKVIKNEEYTKLTKL